MTSPIFFMCSLTFEWLDRVVRSVLCDDEESEWDEDERGGATWLQLPVAQLQLLPVLPFSSSSSCST
jgi:hypothetical protein